MSSEKLDNLLVAKNQAPKVIEMWMHGDITLETLVILNAITNFVEIEGKKITETLLWPEVSRKILKYSPFVKFEMDKYKIIIQKTFTNA